MKKITNITENNTFVKTLKMEKILKIGIRTLLICMIMFLVVKSVQNYDKFRYVTILKFCDVIPQRNGSLCYVLVNDNGVKRVIEITAENYYYCKSTGKRVLKVKEENVYFTVLCFIAVCTFFGVFFYLFARDFNKF